LKQADFEVYEDGVRQEIASFRLVDLPLPDPKKPFVEPRSGAAPATPLVLHEGDSIDGRIYLFVLDDYHLLPQYSYRVKVIVESFVRQRMGPQDIAAITYTSQTPGQELSRPHAGPNGQPPIAARNGPSDENGPISASCIGCSSTRRATRCTSATVTAS